MEITQEQVANICLMCSHDTIILPAIILGYIWLDQRIFYGATCLILTSMISNVLLKSLFQIPLHPKLKIPGYAFPSGHTQSSVVFYGYLALESKNIFLKILLITLLAAICVSLVYFEYHNYIDVAGGLFFGSCLVFLYHIISKQRILAQSIIITLFASSIVLYLYYDGELNRNIFMAYYALIGFNLSELACLNKASKRFIHKLLSTIICFSVVFALKYAFENINLLLDYPIYIREIQWILVGIMIPLSPILAKKIYK